LGDTIGVHGDPLGLDSRGLPVPEYPSESRHRGEQGLVELDVEVLADGSIGGIRIATGSGYARLDTAALEAARKATFEPATLNGQPTVAHVTVPYHFVLR
jgi:protein TonB